MYRFSCMAVEEFDADRIPHPERTGEDVSRRKTTTTTATSATQDVAQNHLRGQSQQPDDRPLSGISDSNQLIHRRLCPPPAPVRLSFPLYAQALDFGNVGRRLLSPNVIRHSNVELRRGYRVPAQAPPSFGERLEKPAIIAIGDEDVLGPTEASCRWARQKKMCQFTGGSTAVLCVCRGCWEGQDRTAVCREAA